MDNLKLDCFLAVAEAQSFSKAADKLYKNQSVISRQVAALENELGVTLFVRSARTVTLTPAGRIFEDGIRKIANTFHSVMEDAIAAQKGYSGEIAIGVHPGNLYLTNMVPIVRAFESTHPEICVTLHSAYSGEIQNQLEDNTVDTVFWRWDEYARSERDYIFVCKSENGLLFSKDHPLFINSTEHLQLSDFKNETFFVLPEQIAPGLGKRLYRICINNRFEPKLVEVEDLETSVLMVSMQRGTIAMNDGGHFACNNAFRFVRIPQLGSTDMSFIWDKRNSNPSLSIFLSFVKQYKDLHPTLKPL